MAKPKIKGWGEAHSEAEGEGLEPVMHVCVYQLLSCVRLFTSPWTLAHQAPRPMGISRQEYQSGFPVPSPNASLSLPVKALVRNFLDGPVAKKTLHSQCRGTSVWSGN